MQHNTNPTGENAGGGPVGPGGAATSSGAEQEAQRRHKRDRMRALGIEPYGLATPDVQPIACARARYDAQADTAHQQHAKEPGFVDARPEVTVAGRIVLLRDNGKLIWLNLRDATGDVQAALSQKDLSGAGFELAKLLDLGDVVVVRGRLMKTRTGEVTVWASHLAMGSKSVVTPPEKHAGLQDTELRYRQRYVDLWANPHTLRVFELRSRIVATLREALVARGYMEVETPMLQALAGGAAARPFVTKMNALGIDLFMRIAPELYLKRLLVGGFPKVFEINRNFRNEGLDKQHNPEFTMLEAYHAFGDMETVMELTEHLVRTCARAVSQQRAATGEGSDAGAHGDAAGALVLPFGELRIDYAKPFRRVRYAELFKKAWGFAMTDHARARAELKRRNPGKEAAIDAMDAALVVNELFEDKQRGGEAQLDPSVPTFITHYPAAISPLTRPNRDDPTIADRADLFIAGMEVAPHYTELNDPDVQEARFREQLRGLDAEKNAEENTFRTLDEDFLRALRVGMPPAGGMGLGVDRLVMLLTDQRTIRDVLLFPMMKPEA